MSKFHNPYQFVPVSKQDGPGNVGHNDEAWPTHLTHARFVRETNSPSDQVSDVFSGRLVCRATVKELLAVGAAQTAINGRPRSVALFKLNGEFALPASSLRGMISSLAEAASNSALRVLHGERGLTLSVTPQGARRPERSKTREKVGDFFENLNQNLVPLVARGGKRVRRQSLTLAEQLFGYVEVMREGASDGQLPALASRVAFSHALAVTRTLKQKEQELTLRILGSPNGPDASNRGGGRYPSFYFNRDADGGFIAKGSLKAGHFPKGRKFYLHRKTLTEGDWKTANPHDHADQKASVRPLTAGEFWFHLDFQNLSKIELDLLCYSLQPSDAFHHKLGLGKPLGWGKLKVEPMGLFLVNRMDRYAVDCLSGERYNQSVWRSDGVPSWPDQYRREHQAPSPTKDGLPQELSPTDLAADYRNWINTNHPGLIGILNAIELLGDPSKVAHPVHYPQTGTDNDFERNLFRWFQDNERQAGQFLQPLNPHWTSDYRELPALSRTSQKDPPGPGSAKPSGPVSSPTGAAKHGPKIISSPAATAGSANTGAPKQPVVSQGPASLGNTLQTFTVTEGKKKKDGTQQPLGLRIEWQGEIYSAGMDFKILVEKGLQPGDTVELRVTGFNEAGKNFSVALSTPA